MVVDARRLNGNGRCRRTREDGLHGWHLHAFMYKRTDPMLQRYLGRCGMGWGQARFQGWMCK